MQRSHERQALPVSPEAEPASKADAETGFATASHHALFEQAEGIQCDACGAEIPVDANEGAAVSGEGEYVWTRGTEVRRQKAPLCPECGTAVLRAAFERWEIEDEG